MRTDYWYQDETSDQKTKLDRVAPGTISQHEHRLGLRNNEPLIITMDAMIRYAKAHKKRFDQNLADDYVLGPYFLEAITGIRNLLCGGGAVANELELSSDSKDNGAVEAMFWTAMDIAGYTEEDI